ncbi:glycosyltransferase family A protein [Parasutterella secunda]|uniref:glycosyltransferase family A protein n=1 Tax=Parasutterella secunda TaxID=626947 RepID=UPI0025A40119|nr:glycosyltransferase family A protein [Parasutterella secunda]MDM8218951.1 glycosyltransferase family A protein [Parasutterella secunda]
MKEKIEVIMSCLNLQDESILLDGNIQSDILIINQCDNTSFKTFSFKDKNGEFHRVRIFSIKQRGLSQSRNLAIDYAEGEILLIADDDEKFIDNYPEIVLNAYKQNQSADLILFDIVSNRPRHKSKLKQFKVGYIDAMRTSSQQISFRRASIIEKKIRFDISMGAGTGNGGGEENRFLFDCLKQKLDIIFIPQLIAQVNHKDSSWFDGYTEEYFINRGYSSKKLLGFFLGFLYVIEWSVAKYYLYKNNMSIAQAVWLQTKGLLFKR